MAPAPLIQSLARNDTQPWMPKSAVAPKQSSFTFDSMKDALAAFAAGEFLIVMDDKDRENEGDLIIAAAQCTTEKMAWMIKHTRYIPQHPIHSWPTPPAVVMFVSLFQESV